MKKFSVAIVGLNGLFREGLTQLVRRARMVVVCDAENFEDLRKEMTSLHADIAIFAVSRGEDPADHLEQIRACRQAFPAMKIAFLTGPLPGDVLRDAATAGAQAVLSNEITMDVLQRALQLLMLGQQLFPAHPESPGPPRGTTSLIPFTRPALATEQGTSVEGRNSNAGTTKAVLHTIFGEAVEISRAMSLSDREKQILRCLMDGAANKTIARQLMITEATVKVHIKGLLRKTRVTNRTQAAVWGLNHPEIFGQTIAQLEATAEPEFQASCQAAS